MSRYERLTAYLNAQPFKEARYRFRDLERVLGFELPPSARAHRAWWSNNPSNNVMTKAWLNAGCRVEQVDMAGETLVFRRNGVAPRPAPAAPTDDLALIGLVLDILRGDPDEAQALRRAIAAALPEAETKTALDAFASDLPDDAFAGVFPEQRDSAWRKIDL